MIEIKSRFYSGRLEVAVMEFPVADLILGNQQGINTSFDPVENNISITTRLENKPLVGPNEMSNVKHEAIWTDNQVKTVQSANSEHKSVLTSSIKPIVNNIHFTIQSENFKNKIDLNNTDIPGKVIPGRCLSFFNSKLSLANEQVSLPCDSSPVIQTEVENFSDGKKINPPTKIEVTDTGIPVGAILTRSKARMLHDIRLPNISVEIPDLSVDKVREMQKNDPSLSKYWSIADGSIVREKNKYPDESDVSDLTSQLLPSPVSAIANVIEEECDPSEHAGQDSDMIVHYNTRQKESYLNVNYDENLSGNKLKAAHRLVENFKDIFSDVPSLTNLVSHKNCSQFERTGLVQTVPSTTSFIEGTR